MDWNFKNRGEANDVVAPENGFELAEIGFGEISAGVDRAIIDAADFEGERIRLRGHQQVRAEAAKFAREAVADVQRDAQRRGGHSHAERERRAGEELVARAAGERIGD